jgi:hypothetical protein
MITRVDTGSGEILGFRLSGTLTAGDYREVLVPEMERAIRQAPKIGHVDRIAVIGRENLDRWMADLMKFFAAFTDAEGRLFREEQGGTRRGTG